MTGSRTASCSICSHPEKVRIEIARLAGCSLSVVADRFGVSRDAVHRHMAKHLTEKDRALLVCEVPIEDLRKRAAEESVTFLEYVGIARKQLLDGILVTRQLEDWTRHAALQGRFIELLKLQGSYSGELRQFATNVTNNVSVVLTASPQFARLQQGLITALAPHPEALDAVLRVLRSIDDDEPTMPRLPPSVIDGTVLNGGMHG